MYSKGLNAGAASFTPNVGGASAAPAVPEQDPGAREDSFSEYAEMMDNIEDAMEDSHEGSPPESPPAVTANSSMAPQTSLPPHLQKHAQEFWFPECRDCTCCNGFKHGCRCAPSNGGTCVCAGAGTIPAPSAAPVPAASGRSYQEMSGHNNNNSFAGRGRGRGAGGRGRVPCKFFFSQGGCRYGDNCTFSHQ
ncbi:zinc finger domain containing protein [Nitzschia inconspicua]|uniref:Zinc finger domain containing protein n=1 Tax=Nitzschia inconspicua TaxID=303405 RepID=A0A9K3LGI6_9STRA|nr:zinc finger domain containing protein [Nitzschia inconspicua]